MKLYTTWKTEWNQQKRFQGMTGDSPLLPVMTKLNNYTNIYKIFRLKNLF